MFFGTGSISGSLWRKRASSKFRWSTLKESAQVLRVLEPWFGMGVLHVFCYVYMVTSDIELDWQSIRDNMTTLPTEWMHFHSHDCSKRLTESSIHILRVRMGSLLST